MAVLRSRTRSVTFRLSASEYEALRKYCIEHHFRSISDLTREAVMERVVVQTNGKVFIGDDLTAIGRSLGELDAALSDLSKRIQKVTGAGADNRG